MKIPSAWLRALIEIPGLFLVVTGLMFVFYPLAGYEPVLVKYELIPEASYMLYGIIKMAVAIIMLLVWMFVLIGSDKPKVKLSLILLFLSFIFFII